MPSRRSQDILGLIRSHKKVASRVSQNFVMKLEPSVELAARMRIGATTAVVVPQLRFPALRVSPRRVEKMDAVLLHLHGGAYVSGGLLQSRALMAPICAASGLQALVFSYRLAPRAVYPAQLEDALAAYDWLLNQGYSPEKILLVGESAGGNLALALTDALRRRGPGTPGALCLLSPWADLAQRGESYRTLQAVDATLDAGELMESARQFAGTRSLEDPCISPVYGDFTGFPPTQIHCGTHEILLSDSENVERAMLRDGVKVQMIRWEGMCHVFQAFGFEESRASINQIALFLRRHAGLAEE